MKRLLQYLIVMMAGWFLLHPFNLFAKEEASLIYVFKINETIAPPVWFQTKKAFQEAHDLGADVILMEMNTYGGMLDAADSIRTLILNTQRPVYVFINKNAASAGALIAIACDSIYMADGSSIGAATVVDGQGKVLPDKYQSYMRAMMRATAEAKGRDPLIAEAMVDPSVSIPGVSDSGKVLTFTVNEALKHGFCTARVNNLDELLHHAGIKSFKLIHQQLSATDKITRLLINPFISGLLIMIIIGGIYFELQTPGIGFPLAAAVIAALLYFAPLYIQGLASHWEIVLFILGLILLALEIFAIPGFGVLGYSGILLVIAGLTLSLVGQIPDNITNFDFMKLIKAFLLVIISMTLGILSSVYLAKSLLENPRFKFALVKEMQSNEGFTVAKEDYSRVVGETGHAVTALRPSGKVEIEGDVFDAVAQVSYIEQGSLIKVIDYRNGQLVVRRII